VTTRFEQTGRAVTNEDLHALENALQVNLPSQYRTFLLRFNGGIPSADTIDVEGLPLSPTDVQVFFGIDRAIASSDLKWNRSTFLDRLPERLLPIACDSGGNLFCILVAGQDVGSVIYADLGQPEPLLYVAARSFDGFLGQLRE
jgi:hypothetical protein